VNAIEWLCTSRDRVDELHYIHHRNERTSGMVRVEDKGKIINRIE